MFFFCVLECFFCFCIDILKNVYIKEVYIRSIKEFLDNI